MAPDEKPAYSHTPSKAKQAVLPRRVFVRDYVTDAEIGVWSHEKGKTQKVKINVDLIVQETDQHHDDQLENVVCYNDIVLGIRKIISSGHINLVETLAEQIADLSLRHRDVISARVRVEKLEAIPEAASVGVEIDRHR
jgi:dihydroneopterin aldolase